MSDWATSCAGLWAKAWELLAAGGAHRFVSLGTIGASGPQTRLVVLRAADRQAATLEIYTDASSTKCGELTRDPRASMLHWTPEHQLQVRLTGRAEVATGADLAPLWEALPESQRDSYGVRPAPGTQIATAEAYDRSPRFEQFARIRLTVQQMDIVHLGADLHRRARFQRDDAWRGHWLAP